MTVQPTSLDAFHDIQRDGTEDTQLEMIMLLLRYADDPMSDADMGRALGLPNGRISARRSKGIENGWITHAGYKKDPITRKRVMTWEAVA